MRDIWVGFWVCLLVSLPAQAVTYSNHINTSEWEARSSVFECRLEHTVPYYGKAVFRTRAGERSGFFLSAKASRFKAGEAKLTTRIPVWFNPNEEERESLMGAAPIKQGKWPLWLDTTWAERMMAELSEGNEVAIKQKVWFNSEADEAELALSSIGFKKAYRRYLDCLAGLLPANFDQLKRTALYFEPGETDELSPGLQRQLDKILALVKHDNKLRMFYIDGHTDSNGDRAENLELSKTRAELVSTYLKRRGIPEDWIVIRWHGERYPVASNATVNGRARNRRVTVRLERIEEIDVLPLGGKSDTAAAVGDGRRAHAGDANEQ